MTKRYYSYEETHRTVNGRRQKLCTKCIKWKDKREFHKDRYRKDGLKIRCKECDKADQREHRRKIRRKRKNIRKYLRYEDRHRVVRGTREKLCSKCRKWKKESEYYKYRSQKDGLMGRCRKCSYKPAHKSRKKRQKTI